MRSCLCHTLSPHNPVTYIVQRQAAMATLFYLLSVCLYLYARISDISKTKRILTYAGVIVSFIIAVLSKENAYTTPIVIILAEIFFIRKNEKLFNFKNYKLYIVAALIIALGGITFFKFGTAIFDSILPSQAMGSNEIVTQKNYFLTQFSVIAKYIQLLFVPYNQNLDYDYQISNSFFELRTIFGFLFLSLLAGLSFLLYNKNRIISFGIAWFFITISIESSFIPLSDIIFEHRTYLPSFGFFIAVVTAIYYLLWNKNKNITLALFVLPILIFSYLTFQRNKVWKTDLSLWDDVVKKSPTKARAYGNRGNAYDKMGLIDNAIADYTKAVELDSLFSIAWSNRGTIYANQQKIDFALLDLNKALEINPNFVLARWNRGVIYGTLAKWENAIIDYNRVIEIDNDFTDAFYNRGVAYANLGDWNKALTDFKKTTELNPQYPNGYYNLAVAEDNLGNSKSAIEDYSKALSVDSGNLNIYFGRGVVYLKLEMWEESRNDFQIVVNNNPEYPGAKQNLEFVIFNMN